jgi:hypothetical protein
VNGIPGTGQPIYVQLWTLINGTWTVQRYTYTASASPCPALITTPSPFTTLTGSSVTLTWGACSIAQAYWLDVGTVLGQGNIFGQNVGLATSQTVNNIPTNGQTIYVQLWTQIGGTWNMTRYTYTASQL